MATPALHPTGPAPNTSTGRAGPPPPRHSIRWSSTISKRFSPKPPRTTAWATVSLYGWRRTCERIYDAASSPTASLAYGVRTAATSGSSRSHANPGASVHHVIRAAWPRSPPTSRITCCLAFPVRQWVPSLPKRLRPFLHHNPKIAGAVVRIFIRAVRRICPHRGRGPSRRRTAAPILCSTTFRAGTPLRTRRHRFPHRARAQARLSATLAGARRPRRARALSAPPPRAARSPHPAPARPSPPISRGSRAPRAAPPPRPSRPRTARPRAIFASTRHWPSIPARPSLSQKRTLSPPRPSTGMAREPP